MERRCLTCTAPGRNNLHTSGIALALSDSPDSRGPVRSVTSFSMMEGASAYSPKFIGRVSRTKQHASIPVRTQIVKSFSSASGLEKYKPRVGTEDTTKGFGQGSQNAHVPRAVQKLRIHARRKVDAAPGSPARRAPLLENVDRNFARRRLTAVKKEQRLQPRGLSAAGAAKTGQQSPPRAAPMPPAPANAPAPVDDLRPNPPRRRHGVFFVAWRV